MAKKRVLIIGGGVAGLSAGVYCQLNGYDSTIVEMHTVIGGVCTSWKRKGFEIDGCCHYLIGSSKDTKTPCAYHHCYSDFGLYDKAHFTNYDAFTESVLPNGERVMLWNDPTKLEKELLRIAPEDAAAIHSMCAALRAFANGEVPFLEGKWHLLKIFCKWGFANLPHVLPTLSNDLSSYAMRFKNENLRGLLLSMWEGNWHTGFILSSMAQCWNKDCGRPTHGSHHMSNIIADRYKALGGTILLGRRVVDLILENDTVVGIRMRRGKTNIRTAPENRRPPPGHIDEPEPEIGEMRCDQVIWTADPEIAFREILKDRYTPAYHMERRKTPTSAAYIQVAFGLRTNAVRDHPVTVMGINPQLSEEDGIRVKDHLVRNNFWIRTIDDPTMVPSPDKALVQTIFLLPFDAIDQIPYPSPEHTAFKEYLVGHIGHLCEKYLPGFRCDEIEMSDVATSGTVLRYTANRRGAISAFIMKPMAPGEPFCCDTRVPRLRGLLVGGTWMTHGGGIPCASLSGRHVVRQLCEEDQRPFYMGATPECITRHRKRKALRAAFGGLFAGGFAVALGSSFSGVLTATAVGVGSGLGVGTGLSTALGALSSLVAGAGLWKSVALGAAGAMLGTVLN